MVEITSLQPLEDDLALKTSALQLADRPELQVYPVLTLPPEIVSDIFEHFLPSFPDFIPIHGVLSPLLLCRICRQWRQIALSTPILWRSIQIDDTKSDDQREHLKTWLARSGACSLAISISYDGSSDVTLSSQYLQTAVLYCQRWEHVEIVVPFRSFHLIHGEMPLLRDLTFGPPGLPSNDEPIISLFDHAPQLQSVHLTGCFVPSVIRLPWAQLTHLEGEYLYEHECTEILSLATDLVHCTMTVCISPTLYIPLSAVPTLPHLRHLSLLSADDDVRLMKILDNVTLPALRTLRVAEPCLGTDPVEALKAFISRSQCTLEELYIDDSLLLLDAYCEAFPSIGTIRIVDPRLDTTY